MAIPKHYELRVPAMELMEMNGTMRLKDFVAPLAVRFNLSEEDKNLMYESGNGEIFYDRISWALSHLNLCGLLVKPRRGYYQLSDLGRMKLLKKDSINKFVDGEITKRSQEKNLNKQPAILSNEQELSSSEKTPYEILNTSYVTILDSIYSEILNTILSKHPTEFEKLVVQLLQKMGYGGEVNESGSITKQSNDGGIDGIIKEDILGFGRIYIQAKRYKAANTVGREEIQKFVGALAVAQSNKGVFITTSSFSNGAINYANSLNGSTTVILIDGNQLAEYIYNYGLGLQVEKVFEIKKLDADFWDEMKEDTTNP